MQLIDAVKSSSLLPYVSRDGFETLKQPWLFLLAVQHPICRSERVPQIWHFVYNLRVNIGGIGTEWLIRD